MKIINNRIEEIREHVNSGMREAALKLIYGIFSQELQELCGPKYSRKNEKLATRAGSDPGSVFLARNFKMFVFRRSVKRSPDDLNFVVAAGRLCRQVF